jgi:hypothetical protein
MSDISQVSKGAVKQPHDPRDFQASFVMGAVKVDWTKEFLLPDPGDEDQGSSSSCVAQASSYFHKQIHSLDWSRRDLYSRIALAGGGAYLRDGVAQICGPGQATRDKAPDPKPETEANMRDRHDITAAMEKIGVEANYYAVNGTNIDVVAAAIRDYKGCIIGVEGDNAGWHDLVNPQPPKDAEWGHALYCMGYHTHNGQKCIIAKSSWCDTGIKQHHIKQNYFESGNTFDGWTLIPKEQQPMFSHYIIFDEATGRQGILVLDQNGFTDAILWAKSQAMLADLKVQYEVPANAPVITLPRIS